MEVIDSSALHQVSQKNLPLITNAAGLPLILGLAGKSKSHSERLLTFTKLGVLDESSARRALEIPVAAKGAEFSPEATEAILEKTGRYPYFLQQWGYETWNMAQSSPITSATFRPRPSARLPSWTTASSEFGSIDSQNARKFFLFAMVSVGGEQQRPGDIVEKLGVKATSTDR
jgi:hypothetical protein